MFEKQLIATAVDSLAHTEVGRQVADADRALQLIEQRMGFGQWKVIFPGSILVSDKACEMFGWLPTDEALPLQDMVKLYHQEDRGKFLTLIAQALEGRRGFQCRLRIERRDGQIRMIETMADLRLRDGRVVELFGLSRDVTKDMERELQVQGRLKLVQDLVSDMPNPVVVVDDRLRVLDCSIMWLKAHRYIERREVVGKTLMQLNPNMAPEFMDEYERGLKGQAIKTKRTFSSSSTNQPIAFNTLITPWYLTERKIGGLTISIGWSEVAVIRGAPMPVANQPPVDFDGSLLDLLKDVV